MLEEESLLEDELLGPDDVEELLPELMELLGTMSRLDEERDGAALELLLLLLASAFFSILASRGARISSKRRSENPNRKASPKANSPYPVCTVTPWNTLPSTPNVCDNSIIRTPIHPAKAPTRGLRNRVVQ